MFETAGPPAVFSPGVKKYLSSKTPTGVCMYLLATVRLTVVSWTPTRSATSAMVIGRRAETPCSRKACCAATISLAIRWIVFWRWWMLLIRKAPERMRSRM